MILGYRLDLLQLIKIVWIFSTELSIYLEQRLPSSIIVIPLLRPSFYAAARRPRHVHNRIISKKWISNSDFEKWNSEEPG